MAFAPPEEDCESIPLKIQCSLHDEFSTIAACETCEDRLVCIQCINSSCFKHTLCNLDEIAERRRQNISCLLKDAESIAVPTLEVSLNQVKRKRALLSAQCDDVSQRIRTHANELKEIIDTICEKRLDECAEFQKRKDEIMKVYEERISKDHDELLNSISKVRDLISSRKSIAMLQNEEAISALSQPKSTTCLPVVAAIWFVPEEVNMSEMYQLFGTMQRSVTICEFEHISHEVRSICLVGDQAWISCEGGNELYLTNKTENSVRSINVRNYFMNQIMDICAGADDSIWVACRDGVVSQIMSHEVKVDRFFIGVHATVYSLFVFKDGDIAVGLVEGVFRMKGKLVRYSQKGEVLDRAVHDSDGNLLFSIPSKVRGCDKSREIAVISLDNKGDHSVVILDADMKFKLNFKGKKPFHPSDVSFDSGQNILISDRANMSIMMLDSHGGICRNIVSASLAPSAICIQGNGDLWTGFENGMVRVYKYAP